MEWLENCLDEKQESRMAGNRRRSRMVRSWRWMRLQYLRLVRENSTPQKSGLGFALGAFIGIFPSFAIGSPLAFFLAGRLQWSRAAALTGTFLMNPLTAPLFYWLSTWLGLRILSQNIQVVHLQGMLGLLREFGIAFLLGNAIVAFIVSAILGFSVYLWKFQLRYRRSPRAIYATLPAAGKAPLGLRR
jgi:uncharacterized protein (DUF2062 family)